MTDIRDRGHPLRFGIVTPQMWRSWEQLLDLWKRIEEAGWDAGFLVDHFVSDWHGESGANLEALTTLGALSRETTTLELGVFVSGVTHRPPMVLAKAAVTLDHTSGGRFLFGLGAAWNEREHMAYGIPFPLPADRVTMVEETLAALRLLEHQERTDFEGSFLTLVDAPFEPKPVRGRLPVVIGSRRPRMLDALARYGDYWDAPTKSEEFDVAARLLYDACARNQRSPDDIVWMHEEVGRGDHGTPEGLAERVRTMSRAGVSFFLVNVWPEGDDSVIETLGRALPDIRHIS